MGLREDVENYREPRTRMVGLWPSPTDHSCDNGLLFSATYLKLLSLQTSSVDWEKETAWFRALVRECQIEPGLIRRYPGDIGVQSHDDLVGIAWFDPVLAREILFYGEDHKYSWNTEYPGVWRLRTFFYRIGGFVPFLKARSGFDLNWFDKLNVALSFLLNTREPSSETSGRCLLYLMANALESTDSWLVQDAIKYWRLRMNQLYPDGIRGLYRVYFGEGHPFTRWAPRQF